MGKNQGELGKEEMPEGEVSQEILKREEVSIW